MLSRIGSRTVLQEVGIIVEDDKLTTQTTRYMVTKLTMMNVMQSLLQDYCFCTSSSMSCGICGVCLSNVSWINKPRHNHARKNSSTRHYTMLKCNNFPSRLKRFTISGSYQATASLYGPITIDPHKCTNICWLAESKHEKMHFNRPNFPFPSLSSNTLAAVDGTM